jgi:hypothetical protein
MQGIQYDGSFSKNESRRRIITKAALQLAEPREGLTVDVWSQEPCLPALSQSMNR